MVNLPTFIPRTAQDLAQWRRSKTVRDINDEMDELHGELFIQDDVYAELCIAGSNREAIEGDLTTDDILAAERARNYARAEANEGRYPHVAAANIKAVNKALRVAKRRHGMAREDMRNRVSRAGGAAA